MDACNLMNKKKGQSVLYASFPEMSNLCCAICEIDFVEVHDASAKSNFHWQTMKCRQVKSKFCESKIFYSIILS